MKVMTGAVKLQNDKKHHKSSLCNTIQMIALCDKQTEFEVIIH